MTAQIRDEMHSGDTLVATIPITDGDGAPVDLTGASATYRIVSGDNTQVHVTKTESDGLVLAGSTVTLTLSPADTAALSGIYYHEMEITDTAGNVSTVLAGTLTIRKDAGNG